MVTLPNYEIVKLIGSGSFGFVFEAIDKNKNQKVALKRIEKVGATLSREYQILYDLKNCENIVQILDFFFSKTDANKLIQNIVFEYMADNLENMLQNFIKTKQNFEEKSIKSYVYQIFKGLAIIHKKSIAHRDMKPENVLVSEDGVIKICDFGSSKYLDGRGKNTPYIVSRYYRAPELILCVTNYSTAIDIWATGCILAELYTKEPLFQGKTEGDQLFAMFKVLGTLSPNELDIYAARVPFEKGILREFENFPSPQMTFRERFHMSNDLDNLLDLFSHIFLYLPEKRITAENALSHPYFKDVHIQH